MMKIHFIAIGGAVMHNFAIAMQQKGHQVTGSDEEIYEPSLSRLAAQGLLPDKKGWDPDRIDIEIDMVILGMQARKNNPELIKAQEYGIPIYSFPEYLYEQSINKKRIVIGGSHGKTTITSMVMHALRDSHVKFDYMVGSQIEGFDPMVKLTDDAPYIILEGDEYLTSPLDPRPKFHLYCPHITLLSGIAWDHMNAFRTFEAYKKQFRIFLDYATGGGKVFYYEGDKVLCDLVDSSHWSLLKIPYKEHPHTVDAGRFVLETKYGEVPLMLFGRHNMQNIQGALLICRELGLKDHQFYDSIQTFKGAERRQQLLARGNDLSVYLDYAHAPSKVHATVNAFRETYSAQTLVTCLELCTESSLNREFLPQYKSTMNEADQAMVFYDPIVVRNKHLPPLNHEDIKDSFGRDDLAVFTDAHQMEQTLKEYADQNCVILIMSSGNFSGIDIHQLAEELVQG
jgi:UDP-N-acetylmuramate: L-alanyl-gamma-D-glutamyl-meso-diaminopimelate ligase